MENSFIETVNKVRGNIDAIIKASDLFSDQYVIEKLESLAGLDLTLIIEDFAKGNYLGTRKIDIDLSLNNLSDTELPTYKQADITLVDGTKLEMPFDNGSDGILELTSHADIKNYIVNHILYAQVIDTEIVVSEAFGDFPAMIRVRDADGKASNVERIELHVYTGTVVDTKPVYFWAKTTSSLETLANRVGDIIQLGNDIDSIVTLSQRIDELIALQTEIANILTVQQNLANVVSTGENIANVNTTATNIIDINTIASKIVELNTIYADLDDILDASNQANIATSSAAFATTKANEASASAQLASEQAALATAKSNEIKGVTAQAQTLVAGSAATASYNPVDGKITFGIPQGQKGDKGDSFTVNAVGLLSNRSLYDLQSEGFSFLAIDEARIYFKLSSTSSDWSLGSPFGKGDKGDAGDTGNGIASVSFVNTTDKSGLAAQSGATDIYRITFTDMTTSDFAIHNGLDSDVFMVDLVAHTSRNDNPHEVTKEQVGLGNVDNTSDENKPISTLQAAALALKANKNDVDSSLAEKADKSDTYTIEQINTLLFKIERPTKVDVTSISVDGNVLDLTTYYPTPTPGTDYFIQKVGDVYSISSTQDVDTIGGFHYGLVPHTEAPTGNKTEADMVNCRGIWGSSIWTKWFRPKEASPLAMNYVPELGYWIDIYLMDGDYANYGYSRANATIAGGATDNGRAIPKIPTIFGGNGTIGYGKLTPFVAWDIANASKKKLIPYKDFTIAAYGVDEGKSSSTNGYESVAGKIEHYPNLLSKYMDQATGTQWIWGADFGNATGGSWNNIADGRGQVYTDAYAVLLGGSRGDGVDAGSRASAWSYTLSGSFWSVGCRFACDHFELA